MRFVDRDLRAAIWCKFSYSGSRTECVEVSCSPEVIGLRDIKHGVAGALTLSGFAWRTLLTQM